MASFSRPLGAWLAGRPIDLPQFFALARSICTPLAELHRREAFHGALHADSILVDADGQVQLSPPAEAGRPGVAGHPAPSGVLAAAMSPEQTGRINRSVDYRTDYYSLGVIFYQLLTGRLPFVTADPLELVHAHIARTPPSPASLRPDVPEMLSRVVMKLLSKEAADRYQSSHGLSHDLTQCEQEWGRSGTVTSFELGRHDVSDRFLIPQQLYGRERELGDLLKAFEASCGGANALLLVAGYSGIGKTSLISELYKPIVRERGYFVSGKFDQVVRNIPYGALIQAFRSLVWQLLTESEERLAGWRAALGQALGANGGVLAEVIPEVALILGDQPEPVPLEPAEAQNRFRYVFQNFVGALARREHPLVVFLDDLQWVDPATLDLLHALLTADDIRHLLVIGAYRDNEVDAAHLVSWAIGRLESSGADLRRVALSPLGLADLLPFVCDTLHTSAEDTRPLAELIQRKTDGNPFFVIQFLKALHQEGFLTFDHDRASWAFRLEAIARAGITDNVVDLMTRKIRRLSPPAQRILTLASCIGSAFEWRTLLTVSRQAAQEAYAALLEGIDAGLVHQVGDVYDAPDARSVAKLSYAFVHDRVQQAAYGLIPDAQKKPVHLDVGRLLLAEYEPGSADDRIFAIVNHLNVGADLIADPSERLDVASLNLAAGRKAKTSAAYRAACEYLDAGCARLDESDWSSQYELAHALHAEAAECRYLAGDFDRAEVELERLLQRDLTLVDRGHVHSVRITLAENRSRWADAVARGREGLRPFGIVFPEAVEEKEAALEREVEGVRAALGDRPIASLIELPEAADPAMRTAMRILTILWAPAYISGDEVLARLISATLVRLSLAHGLTGDSAYGFVTHAITVGPVRKDYRSAWQWGRLALDVNERFNDARRRARIQQQFHAHVNFWCRPFATCLPYAREACRSGLETGDFTYAGYGAATEAWPAMVICRNLDAFVRDFTPHLSLLTKVQMRSFAGAHHAILNWARALQGRTTGVLSLTDAEFDEQAFVAAHEGTAPFFLTFVFASRLHLSLLHGEYDAALEAADRARAAAPHGTMWPVLIEYWAGLALAGAADRADPSRRRELRDRLDATREWFVELAESCPENFRCFWLLLSAEVARLDADPARALALCDDAIRYAREMGNLQQEALGHELGGRAWMARGDEPVAAAYFAAARRAYAEWGASAKVAQLDRICGPLLAPLVSAEAAAPSDRRTLVAPSLDMATVLKMAHAVAVEIELEALLRTLITLAVENAGADRGVFLAHHEGTLLVEAEAVTAGDVVALRQALPLEQLDTLPHTVIRYVQRTGQDVVLGNAASDERFAVDPYVTRTRLKSLLSIPVGHQGRLGGILYLENTLTTEAFTPARLEMMHTLAAQAAISLENARLYDAMKTEVARRTAAEQALRAAMAELEGLKNRLEAENVYLQEEIRTQHNFNEIVGTSPALLDALRKVERVAPTDSTVLIVGETGSGKELFARAVHSRSRRNDRPLVKVNCGAIAPGLVESELFGHVKGAFTGAIDKRVGRFEVANGGTIFLDEVGELPLEAQVKLLRVLQEQEFEPVGSSRTIRVNLRVIAATNRNLDDAVREGRFRADLLYRLNVFPIEVPALRERGSDIRLLAGFFATALSRRLGKPIQGFSARSMDWLLRYPWPGNVRELQNVVERAAILAQGPILEIERAADDGVPAPKTEAALELPAAASLDEAQRAHILRVLKATSGVVEGPKGAATVLGLHPNTLRSRMKKLGISSAQAAN